MFDKFGEFDSVEELNRAAAAQREEGDEEALKALCAENGIDLDEAEDFMDYVMDKLCTIFMAAEGKISVERKELKLKGVLSDWADELVELCSADERMSIAVRRKGKELAGYIAELAESGYEHRAVVSKQIVDKTRNVKKVCGAHEFSIGIPDKLTRKRIAYEYYLGEKVTG